MGSVFVNKFLDFFFPRFCLGCKKEGSWLCEDCRREIKLTPSRISLPQIKVASALTFGPPIDELIHYLKYNGIRELVPILGEFLLKRVESLSIEKDSVIVPVPLYLWRERERGYNQSELLARFLGAKRGMKVYQGLVRAKKTKSQVECKGKGERVKNLKGAFALKEKAPEKIILLDDVLTTGATLNEAARALQRGGTKKLIGLVVATAR